MTFSLQIANGDLVLQGSQLGIVYGSSKLNQDLVLWVTERYGVDRFHRWYGSQLENYIGSTITQSTQSLVYSEVMRVLDNYQKVQGTGMRTAPGLYSLSELLWSINSIDVGIGFDQVNVAVSVANGQQQPTTVTVTQSVS